MGAALIWSLSCLALEIHSGRASAQDTVAAARAFSAGQAAMLSEDAGRAAELFELANRLAPTPEALRSAARARFAAGDLSAAATHAESLLTHYPADERSRTVAEAIVARARPRLVRLTVVCAPVPCDLEVDDLAVALEPKARHVFYAEGGSHRLVASASHYESVVRDVEATAGAERVLELKLPRVQARHLDSRRVDNEETKGSEGWSPWVFALGATVTVGLMAAALWSGLETRSTKRDFDVDPTEALYDEGVEQQRRTNVLLGLGAAAAVGTAAIGLFATGWRGRESSRGSAESGARFGWSVGPSHAAAVVDGRF